MNMKHLHALKEAYRILEIGDIDTRDNPNPDRMSYGVFDCMAVVISKLNGKTPYDDVGAFTIRHYLEINDTTAADLFYMRDYDDGYRMHDFRLLDFAAQKQVILDCLGLLELHGNKLGFRVQWNIPEPPIRKIPKPPIC